MSCRKNVNLGADLIISHTCPRAHNVVVTGKLPKHILPHVKATTVYVLIKRGHISKRACII